MKHTAKLILLAFSALFFTCNTKQEYKHTFLNPDFSIEERVNDLVSQMTLEEKISQMMNQAPGIERLGIPEYNWWSEGLHGIARAGLATVFPQAIGLAASWDEESKELQVSYAVNKTSNTRIQKAIANKGYDTQDLTADNSVYEKLHSCCQYERKSTTAATEKKFAHGENCKHEGEEKCSKACATADGTKKSCCSKEEKH